MTHDHNIPRRNAEGYPDPTAHAALSKAERERLAALDESDARCNLLIRALKALIDLAGFDLLARIELRDRRTGKRYT